MVFVWLSPSPKLKFFLLMDNFYRDVIFVMSDVRRSPTSFNNQHGVDFQDQEDRVSLVWAVTYLSSIGKKVR